MSVLANLKWVANARTWIFVLTTLAAAFASWNVIDEYYILQSMENFLFVLGLWLALPLFNALVGMWSRDGATIRTTLVLAIIYMTLYSSYAFNGSTETREGAQHLHLYLVPLLTALLQFIVGYPMRRFFSWRIRSIPCAEKGVTPADDDV